MSQIRNRLIAIFALIVLLPAIPIGLLVINLVHQTYQIGVNPEVETALARSVEHSRQLYQLRKQDLGNQLQRIIAEKFPEAPNSLGRAMPDDNSQWNFLSLQVYDPTGQIIAEFAPDGEAIQLNSSHFTQLQKSPAGEILIANRVQNRFHAIYNTRHNGSSRFWVLNAAMADQFLRDTDRILQVYQIYQPLTSNPEFIPSRFLYAFFLIGFFLLLLTIGIALFLSRRITRPVNALMVGAQAIGRGDLEYRIPQAGKDEFGKLINRFNQMAGDLKSSQERTIYLEKMAAWQGIARRLAHEIKNPLTPIQLTVQEMVDQYEGDNGDYQRLLQECHQIVNEEIENLRKLVKEFSEFGRLPALEKHAGNVHRLVEEVAALYSHLTLELALEAPQPILYIDEDRIRRVMINLIENAAQAAGTGKPISISSHGDGQQLTITVRDQGPGIAPEVVNRIFDPYFTTKSEGIGLGLAITRKMVEEHGGNIAAFSSPEGGASFIFTLPLQKIGDANVSTQNGDSIE